MWKEGYVGENVILLDKTEQVKDDQTDPRKGVSLDDLSKNLEQQASKISQPKSTEKSAITPANQPAQPQPATPTGINLSVKDVKTAAKKQSQAQKMPDPNAKKGFWGIFK